MPRRPTHDPAAVDAYLAALPEAERAALERVRAAVLNAVPEAEERIGYGIPLIAADGDLVGFAAQSKHLALYVMSPALMPALADDLARFKTSGATIHFSPDRQLPLKLIHRIARARLRENRAARK